jgi:hypothetical protein
MRVKPFTTFSGLTGFSQGFARVADAAERLLAEYGPLRKMNVHP